MSTAQKLFTSTNAPFSQEAEEATLGAVLSSPAVYYSVARFLTPDAFFILRHRYIWEAMGRLIKRSEPIEYLTVAQELKDAGKLAEIGGPAYLTQLINATPTSTHAEVYGRLVLRAAQRRRLMAYADEIKALALNEELPVDDVFSASAQKLMDITPLDDKPTMRPFSELVDEYFNKMLDRIENGKTSGLLTGFKNLDHLLSGLHKGDLILLGGRPGMGKTAFALSTIFNIMKADPQKRIALFSLEMSGEQVVQRSIAMESGLNVQSLRTGMLAPSEVQRFVETSGKLTPYKLFVDDKSSVDPMHIRATMKRLCDAGGPFDLLVIDYVQLMDADNDYGADKRVQEISYISRNLKGIAKQFDVPVFAMCSLNRSLESRSDKRPVPSDLRESGSLESDADVVMFVYRDEVYNEATEFPNQADIIIAKHRNGPTGTISLYYEKTLTKFLNAAERSVDLSNI